MFTRHQILHGANKYSTVAERPVSVNRRSFLAAATAVGIASTAGCSGLTGGGSGGDTNESVSLQDNSAGATGVTQTLRIPVSEEIAGETLASISATYPRDRFLVDSASHEDVVIGVDASGDGALDEEFGPDAISGINNNDFSFTINLDTDYELSAGDVVMLDYPAIDNPDEAGEYEVTVALNEGPEQTVTVEIA
jgi:hypothetical protein